MDMHYIVEVLNLDSREVERVEITSNDSLREVYRHCGQMNRKVLCLIDQRPQVPLVRLA